MICKAMTDGAVVITGPRREVHKAGHLDGRVFVEVYKSLWESCGSYAAEICRRQSVAMGRRG